MAVPKKMIGLSARRTGLILLALAGIFSASGCDLTEFGGYYDYYDPYGFGSLGFLPDASVVQSVNDYRQDVFDTANDAWDEYIRE
ncbi:MAG TPA: hypothetical protein VJZ71_04255 [Phycisphaerae bacterium]|nr:hypothetical protein [Phycisphaerae bacterium]